MLTAVEQKGMEDYVNHCMAIGAFPRFVEENQRPFDVLYRGIMCHQSKLVIGGTLEHFEPLLSCSSSREVSEDFAVLKHVPEDMVEEEARKIGYQGTNDEKDIELYNQTYEEFKPVVMKILGAGGVRILDYMTDYEYANELEVVVKSTPLTILELEESVAKLGEPYLLVTVTA